MYYFKLQLGCLFIVLYYLVIYLREYSKNKMKCNIIFDFIIGIAPWAIIFDGATAWTVNHRDIVTDFINIILHGLFFVFVDLFVILVFAYMLNLTLVNRDSRKHWLFFIPGIIAIIVTVSNLTQLYYVNGKNTDYSMGISVIASYLSLFLHYLLLVVLLIRNHRMLEKKNIVSVTAYIIVCYLILGLQVLIPEFLISSFLPTISVIFIYENFENPSMKKLNQFNQEMVTGFATLVENRDDNTGGHINRTKGYVNIIIDEMRKSSKYKKILTKDYVENVINAAPMHDIGKISTPDSILLKKGKLDAKEYEIMKQHAPVGSNIIKKTFSKIEDEEYLKITYEVARFHHEKWNGKGYPDGLSGEDIPLHARIMAIADVFDALSAKRCYKEAFPLEKCFTIIKEGAGTDFDPMLVEIFLNAREKVVEFYNENSD